MGRVWDRNTESVSGPWTLSSRPASRRVRNAANWGLSPPPNQGDPARRVSPSTLLKAPTRMSSHGLAVGPFADRWTRKTCRRSGSRHSPPDETPDTPFRQKTRELVDEPGSTPLPLDAGQQVDVQVARVSLKLRFETIAPVDKADELRVRALILGGWQRMGTRNGGNQFASHHASKARESSVPST